MSSAKIARSSHEEALSLVRRVPPVKSAWVYARAVGHFLWRSTKRCWAELRGNTLLLHVVGEQSSRANPEQLAKRTAAENIMMVSLKEARVTTDTKWNKIRIRRTNGERTIELKLKDAVETKKWHAALTLSATQRAVSLNDFEVIAPVGKGASGRVFLVRDRVNGERLALKVIEKTSVYENDDAYRHALDERLVLEMACDHPFILNLRYAFQTNNRLYLVTEYCDGGDLFDYLKKRGKPFKEAEGRRIAGEILLALEYIHSLGVVYRDLKLENVLLDLDGHVRIADFGLSKLLGKRRHTATRSYHPPPNPHPFPSSAQQIHSTHQQHPHVIDSNLDTRHQTNKKPTKLASPPLPPNFNGGSHFPPSTPTPTSPTNTTTTTSSTTTPGKMAVSMTKTFCGTREYVAPEMLSGNEYGQSVDLWAFGILLYEILCGRTPFYSRNREEVYSKIENGALRFPRNLSQDVVSLIRGLLDRNPNTRLGLGAEGINEIKRHPFFRGMDWEGLLDKAHHQDNIVVEKHMVEHASVAATATATANAVQQQLQNRHNNNNHNNNHNNQHLNNNNNNNNNAAHIIPKSIKHRHDPKKGSGATGGGGDGAIVDKTHVFGGKEADVLLEDETEDNKKRPDIFAKFVATKKKATNVAGYTYMAPPPPPSSQPHALSMDGIASQEDLPN